MQAPVEDKGTQVVEVPKKDDDENKVFNKVEVEASFLTHSKLKSLFESRAGRSILEHKAVSSGKVKAGRSSGAK